MPELFASAEPLRPESQICSRRRHATALLPAVFPWPHVVAPVHRLSQTAAIERIVPAENQIMILAPVISCRRRSANSHGT